jgi:integrase
MTRPRPPYLIKRIARNGETTWYVWKRPFRQIRIRGEYGSEAFVAAYHAALNGKMEEVEEKSKHAPETLAWLIERYRETSAWSDLAEATRRQRENIFKNVIKSAGDTPYQTVKKASIVATRDSKRQTPSAANNFINTMRGLFDWAVDAGLIEANPTVGVKGVKRPKTGGFHQWTEDELAKFEAHWKLGTRERLAFEIMLNLGLRRGDVATLGKQHFSGGRIRLVTEKTKTWLDLPASPRMLSVIAGSQTGDLVLLSHAVTGRPMTKEGLGNWFRKAAVAAGVDGNCHGLRKAAATRLAEAGATIPELNAVFGWTGTAMASLYTEKANRAKLADNAAMKGGNK